jgi:hypothetical protein
VVEARRGRACHLPAWGGDRAPQTWQMSTPDSRDRRRTAGDARALARLARSSLPEAAAAPPAAAGDAAAGAAPAAAADAAGGAAAWVSPAESAVEMVHSTLPVGTMSPCLNFSSCTTPSNGEEMSTLACTGRATNHRHHRRDRATHTTACPPTASKHTTLVQLPSTCTHSVCAGKGSRGRGPTGRHSRTQARARSHQLL